MKLLSKLFGPKASKALPKRVNYLGSYHLAKAWIEKYSIANEGIAVNSGKSSCSYPEVTGYFIPSLLAFGERERALDYAHWLTAIQDNSGAWRDPSQISPYTFDTGQILKGLLALVERNPEFEPSITKGCDWILSQIEPSGRLTTPDTRFWKLPGGRMTPEAIHLYCLEPIKDAGKRFGNSEYLKAVNKVLDYYLSDEKWFSFNTLSHFHAYIIEALVDLDCTGKATDIMDEVAKYQRDDGTIPGYRDVEWVCSVGLLQYAVIWYKLGNHEKATLTFDAALALQNESGGFYGGYGKNVNYFPTDEISWAIKYFLDAFALHIRADFNHDVSSFPENIEASDGRYQLLKAVFDQAKPKFVLDLGCGKGRFLKKLMTGASGTDFFGADISEAMLHYLPENAKPLHCSLLDITAQDSYFDFAYCIEALEHAVDIPNALKEMNRILKPGGTLLIIDKNSQKYGSLKISSWEQWFDAEELTLELRRQGFTSVTVHSNIAYGRNDGSDGLFIGWAATKG